MSLRTRQTQQLAPIPEGRRKGHSRQPSRAKLKQLKCKASKSLHALFDFHTFALDSALLSPAEADARRQTADVAVSALALQEYTNAATRVTLSVVVFGASDMKRLTTARLPCLGGAEPIYMQKLKDRESGELWMDISRVPPKHDHKVRSIRMSAAGARRANRVRWAPEGMAIVMLWSTFAPALQRRAIINDIYYHPHGAPACMPTTPPTPGHVSQAKHSPAKPCVMPRSRCAANVFVADTESALKRHAGKSRSKHLRSKSSYNLLSTARASSRSKSDGQAVLAAFSATKKKRKKKDRRKSAPNVNIEELTWTAPPQPQARTPVGTTTTTSSSTGAGTGSRREQKADVNVQQMLTANKSRRERRVSASNVSVRCLINGRAREEREGASRSVATPRTASALRLGVCGDDLDGSSVDEEEGASSRSSPLALFDVAFSSFPAFGSTPSPGPRC